MTKEKTKKIALVLALVIAAAVSFLPVASLASDPGSYTATITSIDEKTDTVMKLTAACTVASAAISAIPDDTATPIAEKLADFTEYFLLILCTLYAEKYLLTILGTGIFQFLIPAACLILAVGILRNHGTVKRLAVKFMLFGLALFIAIPISIRASDMVYLTYQDSIQQAITSAEDFGTETAQPESGSESEGFFSAILDKVTSAATGLTHRAASILNSFIESLAVMIVTSCIIPLLVLLFFFWVAKSLTGLDLSLPRRRFHRKKQGVV